MLRETALLCAVSWSLSPGASAAMSFQFHYDATESANVVYHLACLGHHIPCTREVFERFWHDQLQWSADDQRQLDAWKEMLTKAKHAAAPLQPAPYLGNTPSIVPALNAHHQVIRAAIEAKSLADLERRTKKWLEPGEAARLRGAVEHFRGRLAPWWRSAGPQSVQARIQQTEKNLRKYGMPGAAAKVAAFVEASPATRDVYIHAVASPAPHGDAAGATVVANHFFVEITDEANPESIAVVSLHELAHYFYDTAAPARHAALMQQFVQSGAPRASALYALLNEAIAISAQSLIGDRLGGSGENDSDRSGYRHAWIPRAAKPTVPIFREWVAKGSTLYQGFAQAYIREAGNEFKDDINNPRFFLSAAAILPSETAGTARDTFLEEFQPVISIGNDDWKLLQDLNLVFLVTYGELPAFRNAFPDLMSHSNKRGFAFIGPRGERANICILAGADGAALQEVVRAFARQRAVSPGSVLTVE